MGRFHKWGYYWLSSIFGNFEKDVSLLSTLGFPLINQLLGYPHDDFVETSKSHLGPVQSRALLQRCAGDLRWGVPSAGFLNGGFLRSWEKA